MSQQVANDKSSPAMQESAAQRAALKQKLFPEGVPTLWCPSLTHYNSGGGIDGVRIAAHLRHLAPYVKGFLIPGSTSDGWELTDAEFWQLLDIALEQTQRLGLHLLVGVLKANTGEARETIGRVVEHLQRRTQERDAAAALPKAGVCGFTVCAPRGQQVSQAEMERGLVPILELGLPIALYQLPQVTENELSPELVCALAERFPNFLLFKDSSGADRTVLCGKNLGGVFTMRGAEGDYARWLLAPAPARYDGFLLSTANCFAADLTQMISQANAERLEAARVLSDRITRVTNEMFALARQLPGGIVYANANKAIDHFFAHGPGAEKVSGPRLHSGSCLPPDLILKTGEVLRRYNLLPQRGYAAGTTTLL